MDDAIMPPYLHNDHRCESISTKEKDGEVSQYLCNTRLSEGLLREKTAVRFVRDTKFSRSMFTNKLLLLCVPCVFQGQRPRTSMAKRT